MVRVAVLGDSFIEGFQVQRNELVTSRLEHELNDRCRGVPIVEVLNFGHSGFGTAEEYETFRHRAKRYHPDLVLLFFYPSNDLFDNSHELGVDGTNLYYFIDHDGTLQRGDYEVHDSQLKKWLRNHSRAFLFVRDRVKRVEAARRVLVEARVLQDPTPKRGQQSASALEILQSAQYLDRMPAEIERSWRVTEALLQKLRDEVHDMGSWFGIVVIPNREEVINEGPLDERLDRSEYDYRRSLRTISEVGDRLGIPVLHLLDPIEESRLPFREIYFAHDGHWTPSGHEIAAKATAKWVGEEICSGP